MSPRVRRRLSGFVWLALLAVSAAIVFVGIRGGKAQGTAFRDILESTPYANRLDVALAELLATQDDSVAAVAVAEIVETADQLGRQADAAQGLNQYLSSIPEGSDNYQDAYYALAKVLHTSSPEQAESLFQNAIAKDWVAKGRIDAFEAYKESLYKSDPPRYALEQFNYAMSDSSGAVYARYHNYMALLGIHKLWSLRLRKNGGQFSATQDVLPNLSATPDAPHHLQIAEALCYMVDEAYGDAVDLLIALDRSLPNAPAGIGPEDLGSYFAHNEKLNIPAYVATAQILEGLHLDDARANMEEFWRRNQHRPEHVAGLLLRITYALEVAPRKWQRRINEVTGFLIDAGFTSEPLITGALLDSTRLRILDIHMCGLFFQRRFDDAKPFAEAVVAEYDPSKIECNNSLFCLGCINRRQNEFENAEKNFLELMNNGAGPIWSRAAASQLAHLRMDMGVADDHIRPLLEKVWHYASPEEQNYYRYSELEARYQRYLSK